MAQSEYNLYSVGTSARFSISEIRLIKTANSSLWYFSAIFRLACSTSRTRRFRRSLTLRSFCPASSMLLYFPGVVPVVLAGVRLLQVQDSNYNGRRLQKQGRYGSFVRFSEQQKLLGGFLQTKTRVSRASSIQCTYRLETAIFRRQPA